MSATRYVPAAGRAAFTGLYDAVVAATMRERRWRAELVRRAAGVAPPGGRIVDVGAGTGTLAIALAGGRPDAEVVAVDRDPAALRIARRKRGAERVVWRDGLADALPLDDGCADAAVMSLLLHHLDRAGKLAALREARRVLRPGGTLLVADWGAPTPGGSDPKLQSHRRMGSDPKVHSDRRMGSDPEVHSDRRMGSDPRSRAGLGPRALAVLDGAAGLDDHLAGRLPSLIADAGFELVAARGGVRTVWGTLELLDYRSPGS
jgi:SAM-dependent methyltransferase